MNSAFCSHCGKPLEPGNAFCANCGHPAAPVAAPAAAPAAAPVAAPTYAPTAPRPAAPQKKEFRQDIQANYLYSLVIGGLLLLLAFIVAAFTATVMGTSAVAAVGFFAALISVPVLVAYILGTIFISSDAKSGFVNRRGHETVLSIVTLCVQLVWLLLCGLFPSFLLRLFRMPEDVFYVGVMLLRPFAIAAFAFSVFSALASFLIKRTMLAVIIPYAVAATFILVMLAGVAARFGLISGAVCLGVIQPIVLITANVGFWKTAKIAAVPTCPPEAYYPQGR